jgi:hypothetical protein
MSAAVTHLLVHHAGGGLSSSCSSTSHCLFVHGTSHVAGEVKNIIELLGLAVASFCLFFHALVQQQTNK